MLACIFAIVSIGEPASAGTSHGLQPSDALSSQSPVDRIREVVLDQSEQSLRLQAQVNLYGTSAQYVPGQPQILCGDALVDAESGKILGLFASGTSAITESMASADGQRIITLGSPAALWDRRNFSLIEPLQKLREVKTRMVDEKGEAYVRVETEVDKAVLADFAPDGTTLAVAMESGEIVWRESATGSELGSTSLGDSEFRGDLRKLACLDETRAIALEEPGILWLVPATGFADWLSEETIEDFGAFGDSGRLIAVNGEATFEIEVGDPVVSRKVDAGSKLVWTDADSLEYGLVVENQAGGFDLVVRTFGGRANLKLPLQGEPSRVLAFANRTLAYTDVNGDIWILNLDTKTSNRLADSGGDWNCLSLSRDGKALLAFSSLGILAAWETSTGRQKFRNEPRVSGMLGAGFTSGSRGIYLVPDGSRIFYSDDALGGGFDDLSVGFTIASVELSPAGDIYLVCGEQGELAVVDVASRNVRRGLSLPRVATTACFVADGDIVVATEDGVVARYSVQSGGAVSLSGDAASDSVQPSENGRKLLARRTEFVTDIWPLHSREHEFRVHSLGAPITAISLSENEQYVAIGTAAGAVHVFDLVHWRRERSVELVSSILSRMPVVASVTSLDFTDDGSRILIASLDGRCYLAKRESGEIERVFAGHDGGVQSAKFNEDESKVITASLDGSSRIFEVGSGDVLATILPFRDGSWAVTSPAGYYDSSTWGNVAGLHWVVEDKARGITEPVALEQFAAYFFEPGLLGKILSSQPLGTVPDLRKVALYPLVQNVRVTGSVLTADVVDRGGGIGEVVVKVDGQEVLRKRGSPVFRHDLAEVLSGRSDPRIEIIATNGEGSLQSRSESVRPARAQSSADPTPSRYVAIIAGIEKYAADHLELGFSADDACAVTKAILALAEGLGIEPTIYLLADSPEAQELASPNVTVLPPSRKNFDLVFQQITELENTSNDLFFLYLAGHGLAVPGERPQYFYLTQEARDGSPSSFVNKQIQLQWAIGGDELVSWLSRIKSGKRVMMLDTCSAGAMAGQTASIGRSDDEDRSRALRDFQSRTGIYALFGSPDSLFSYEAPQFRHGLMTYTFLEQLRAAQLSDVGGSNAVFVDRLFIQVAQATRERAQSLDRVQEPRYSFPDGEPFPIGLLDDKLRSKIPLPEKLPVVLRPSLVNAAKRRDDLNLEELIVAELRKQTQERGGGRTSGLAWVFSDRSSDAEGYRIFGDYDVIGDRINLRLAVSKGDEELGTLPAINSVKLADAPRAILEALLAFFKNRAPKP